MEGADGFVGFNAISPVENFIQFWLITYWENKDSSYHWQMLNYSGLLKTI